MDYLLYAFSVPPSLALAAMTAAILFGDKRWCSQILIAIDQLYNAVLKGWADETISSRAWRRRTKSRTWRGAQVAIDWVFEHVFRDPNHCEQSFASERLRLQMPPELREGGAL